MPQMLVKSVRDEAKDIKTFELVDPQYGALKAFNATQFQCGCLH
jgi:ferredoxin-NADP reductase